jgi:hypothetical protein
MPILPFPSGNTPVITQADLDNIAMVRHKIRTMQALQSSLEEEALRKMQSGCEIEPGPRNPSIKSEKIDGRLAQWLDVG